MPNIDDLYAVLQVHDSAEPEVIEVAYRRLARKYHPDVNASPDATEIMQRLNDAYAVLSDPQKRSTYDHQRRARRQAEPKRQGPTERQQRARQAQTERSEPTGQWQNANGRAQREQHGQRRGPHGRHERPSGPRKPSRTSTRFAIFFFVALAALLASDPLQRMLDETWSWTTQSSFEEPSVERRVVLNESSTRRQQMPRRTPSQPEATRQSSRSQQPERPAASSTPLSGGIDYLSPPLHRETRRPSGDLDRRSSSRPSSHQTSTAYFTRGSHQDDVLRIEGTPDEIQRYPVLGHEVWRYGRSRVNISTRSQQVIEWSNSGRRLNVRLEPGTNITNAAYFTRGSHQDDVLRIEGTPDEIQRYPVLGHEVWRYGRSRVNISTRSRQVIEWSNSGRNLNVRLEPGANITNAAYFTRGSHQDDVLRIEGTPDEIQRYPALGHEVWRYGRSRVNISTRSRQVIEWSNSGRNLDVQLNPSAGK